LLALKDDHPTLRAARAAGGATGGVRCSAGSGHLRPADPARAIDAALGALAAMSLTRGGLAPFNIANAAAAALAAHALGVPTQAIVATLARFGSRRADNAGRLEHWQLADVQAWFDFAHKPDDPGAGTHGGRRPPVAGARPDRQPQRGRARRAGSRRSRGAVGAPGGQGPARLRAWPAAT
jgi:hypothetical protein